jgi:hypothetical protein
MNPVAAHRLFACALFAVLTGIASPGRAQQAPLQDKPFAEHKVVLQLSDKDLKREMLVISVAYNLMKLYRAVDIEAVESPRHGHRRSP